MEELALAHVLEQCLDAMEGGETNLDRLLSPHPEAAIELRPLLEIALRLRASLGDRGAPISLDFHNELRERLREGLRV